MQNANVDVIQVLTKVQSVDLFPNRILKLIIWIDERGFCAKLRVQTRNKRTTPPGQQRKSNPRFIQQPTHKGRKKSTTTFMIAHVGTDRIGYSRIVYTLKVHPELEGKVGKRELWTKAVELGDWFHIIFTVSQLTVTSGMTKRLHFTTQSAFYKRPIQLPFL